MVTRSNKAILRRVVLLEELKEFMERKEGVVWTENDAKLTMAMVREIQASIHVAERRRRTLPAIRVTE